MMDFNFSKESLELQDKLKTFFADHIYPNEELYEKAIIDSGDPLHIPEILNELKSKAKSENLWNLFLPDKEYGCLLYTSPSPRDDCPSRMPSSA